LYLILLILLIKYLSLPSTLTSRGGSYIYLGRASNTGAVGRRTNVWNTGWILTVLGSFSR
jgi:hypothetical protein